MQIHSVPLLGYGVVTWVIPDTYYVTMVVCECVRMYMCVCALYICMCVCVMNR